MFKNISQDKELKDKGAQFLLRQSSQYLQPLEKALDRQADSRLVRTFFNLFVVILTFRNRAMGLLLSELGGYICGFGHAQAGAKRISNLLRSPKWSAQIIDDFLFNQSQQRIEQLKQDGKRPLALWDDSRLEKPESWFAQGLCSVVSSKGKRLTKIKRGFYRLFKFEQDWLIRWKTNHLLINDKHELKKTHLLARSCKAQDSKLVWDKERKNLKRATIAWAAVKHPDHPDYQLSLVIVRDKNNYNGPMYLLTSLPVESAQQAWEICFAYMHRWNIEQAFRFGKSELAMESPRLWFWENRLKLLAIVALAYDFLLRLLRNWMSTAQIIMTKWAHRTGNRYRIASIPVYRLRMAISNCLFFCLAQNSG